MKLRSWTLPLATALLVTTASAQNWTRVAAVSVPRGATLDRSYGPSQINGRSVLQALSRLNSADYVRGLERVTATTIYTGARLQQTVGLFGATASLFAQAWGQMTDGRAYPAVGGGYSYLPGSTVTGQADVIVNGNLVWSRSLNTSRSLDMPPIVRELTRQRHTEHIPIGGVVSVPVTVEVVVQARLAVPASIVYDMPNRSVTLQGGINPYLSGSGSVSIGWELASVGIRADLRLCNATLGLQLHASPASQGGRLFATFQAVSLSISVYGGVTVTIRIPLPFGLSLEERRTYGFQRELFRWSTPTWSDSRNLT